MSEPSRLVTQLVDLRDNQSCVRCGVSLWSMSGSRHHRKLLSLVKDGVSRDEAAQSIIDQAKEETR